MIIVNLYGGPGCGKSTTAAVVFAKLKELGIVVELAREAGKMEVWAKNHIALQCQPFLFGRQLLKLQTLETGGCAVAVSDSPLLLQTIYGSDLPESFCELVGYYDRFWPTTNFVLRRAKKFQQRGRIHTESESIAIDSKLRVVLDSRSVDYKVVSGDAFSMATEIVDSLGAIVGTTS